MTGCVPGGEQEHLDSVKEQFRSSREEQLRENGFWLSQIRSTAQQGRPLDDINRFDARLDALTLDDIADVAGRSLPEDRYVRVALFPEEN